MFNFTGLLHIHLTFVILFLLSLLIKTALLLFNRHTALEKFRKKTLVLEMIIDTLLLVSGIALALQSGMVQMGNWFWIKMVCVFAAIPISIIAFRRGSKVLALLGLILVLYAYGIAETKSATMNTEATLIPSQTKQLNEDMPTLELGEAVYHQDCQVCHGVNGEKGKSGAPKLKESTMPVDQMVTQIKEGKKAMPGYEQYLSDAKIQAVAAYVKTLREE